MSRRKYPMWRSKGRNYVWSPDRWLARYRARRLARGRTTRWTEQTPS